MNKFEKFFLTRNLDEDEEVIYIIHKHWIEFILPLIKRFIIWIIIPLFLIWLYPEYFHFIFVWFFFVFIMAFYDFFDRYMDVLILTNYSIIESRWDWFTKSSSSRMEYEAIEDVHFEISWFLSSIFEFWDLYIERTSWWICFTNTWDPSKVELKILEAKRISKWLTWSIDMDWLKDLLSDLVSEHIQNNPIEKWVVKKWFRRG